MNVSSVKNLNGETFSAVQDASLTNVVQTNSGNWQDITTYQNASAMYLTGVSIPVSAIWNEVSTTVQINSANWADGGAISSYTTTLSPYGNGVINTLNEKYISAFFSQSADNSNFADNANSANSAKYAETVNETYLENKGFARNLSSEYGTVSIVNNNIIESTNSAISRVVVNEGFASAFNGQTLGPEGNGTATYSWDKALPNTIIALNIPGSKNEILTYSANTNLTGEIALPAGQNTQTINIPNATEFKVWASNWVYVYKVVVSAADQFETTVGELAWASALPTYEYDTNTNKISAINGSAIGGDVPISAGPGIKVNLVDNTLVFSNDETVLFETTAIYGADVCNLSESLKNFERIGVKPTRGYTGINPGGAGPWNYFDTDQIVGGSTEPSQVVCPYIMEYINWKTSQYNPNADCTVLTWSKGFQKNMESNAFYSARDFTDCVGIQKVIGINRKA